MGSVCLDGMLGMASQTRYISKNILKRLAKWFMKRPKHDTKNYNWMMNLLVAVET
jgi:hypothetical protein